MGRKGDGEDNDYTKKKKKKKRIKTSVFCLLCSHQEIHVLPHFSSCLTFCYCFDRVV